jgi:hypothetical protein
MSAAAHPAERVRLGSLGMRVQAAPLERSHAPRASVGIMLLGEDAAVRLEAMVERKHGFVDLGVLLAVVFVALVTWSCLADAASVPLWRTYTSVGLTVLFALAALTRRPHWAAAIRCLMGGWLMIAPYALAFADILPARWAYLATGIVLMTLSLPPITAPFVRRTQEELSFSIGAAEGLEA